MRQPGRSALICVAIVSLWSGFAIWLACEEYGKGARVGYQDAGLPAPVLCDAPQGHRQMGVYFGGRRVGRMIQETTTTAAVTRTDFDVLIDLAQTTGYAHGAGAASFPARITGRSVLSDGALRAFNMTVNLHEWDAPVLSINLHVEADTARLSVQRGAESRLASLPLDSEAGSGLRGWPLGDFAGLCAQGGWSANLFNPVSMRFEEVEARVVAQDEFSVDGERVVANVVHVGGNALATRLWIDARGEVLRQQAMGFDFIREFAPAVPAPAPDILAVEATLGGGPDGSLAPAPIARGSR